MSFESRICIVGKADGGYESINRSRDDGGWETGPGATG